MTTEQIGQAFEDARTRMAGALMCRNHLEAILGAWDECTDEERREAVERALSRLDWDGIE